VAIIIKLLMCTIRMSSDTRVLDGVVVVVFVNETCMMILLCIDNITRAYVYTINLSLNVHTNTSNRVSHKDALTQSHNKNK
jgi:hypothetical protein